MPRTGPKPDHLKEFDEELARLPQLLAQADVSKEDRRDLKKYAKVELRDFAQRFTRQAVLKLVDLMEHAESEDLQARCADLLLQYGHGKPVQQVAGQFDGKLTISWAMPGDEGITIDVPSRQVE